MIRSTMSVGSRFDWLDQLQDLVVPVAAAAVKHWYNQSRCAVSLASDAVHADLRDAILSGSLAPGDAVPSERELSERLGVNRHAVREAVKRLQQARLVQVSQGGATRVLDWRETGGLDLLLDVALARDGTVDAATLRAIGEMRACIGSDAARLCAMRAPAKIRRDIAELAEQRGRGADGGGQRAPLGRDRRRLRQPRLPACAQHAARGDARSCRTSRPNCARRRPTPRRSPRSRRRCARATAKAPPPPRVRSSSARSPGSRGRLERGPSLRGWETR